MRILSAAFLLACFNLSCTLRAKIQNSPATLSGVSHFYNSARSPSSQFKVVVNDYQNADPVEPIATIFLNKMNNVTTKTFNDISNLPGIQVVRTNESIQYGGNLKNAVSSFHHEKNSQLSVLGFILGDSVFTSIYTSEETEQIQEDLWKKVTQNFMREGPGFPNHWVSLESDLNNSESMFTEATIGLVAFHIGNYQVASEKLLSAASHKWEERFDIISIRYALSLSIIMQQQTDEVSSSKAQEALEALGDITTLLPFHPQTRFYKAFLLFRMGQKQQAIAELNELIKLSEPLPLSGDAKNDIEHARSLIQQINSSNP